MDPITLRGARRIESLDWLRGLMALSIMSYHYVSWEIAEPPINSVLGKLGIYAVSIFFILSGLSLAIVYNNYIKGLKTSLFFLVRRVFRIWPVLWLTGFFVVILELYNHQPIDLKVTFLNLTTLFGFFDYTHYISAGVWSIGNEMVYYVFTPFIIALFNKSRLYGNISFALTVIIGLIFSFHWIDSRSNLTDVWDIYINPFNNLFLFVSGFAIYFNFKDMRIKREITLVSLIAIALIFTFFEVGRSVAIITGINRIIFSCLSIIAVFFFWKLDLILPKLIQKPWTAVCLASYSIYLLHPLVLQAVMLFMKGDWGKPFFVILFLVALSVALALSVYRFIEKPFITLGKKLTPATIEPAR